MSVYPKKRKDGTTTWFIDFYINGKRHRQLGGATKTQAERALHKVKGEILRGKFDIVKKVKNISFVKFAEIYKQKRPAVTCRPFFNSYI